MSAAFNKFDIFVQDLAHKQHDFSVGGDSINIMLSNVAPVRTNTVKSDITEIAAGHGYTAGGPGVTATSSSQTSGVWKWVVGTNPSIVCGLGGSIGPFRYAVLYNSSNNKLIGWWDYGPAWSSGNTLNTGDTFTFDMATLAGVLSLT